MSTRRERLEARLEKRREWQASRAKKSEQAQQRAHTLLDGIPLGQPILVGHHSEKRHRRTIDRASNAMNACVEHDKMSKEHGYKASGLERALDTSIFSDDPDAPEALAAKLAELEAKRETLRKLGAAWRKAKKPKAADEAGWKKVCELLGWEFDSQACKRARLDAGFEEGFLNRGPVPSYVLSNLGGNITRAKKRIEEVKRRRDEQTKAEAAPNGMTIERGPEWCAVKFAEKPERSILDALRGADFHWSGGKWFGRIASLPACVLELESGPTE